MPLNGVVSKTTLALCLGGVSHAYAESATDPISTIGVIASHNRYTVEFDDGEEIEQDERLNQGGLFYTFGNKLTGQEGMIYQIGVEGQYNDKDEITYKSAQAELDVGARAALSTHNYVDIVLGGGYGWGRIEQDGANFGFPGEDIQQTTKLPFAKAGLGYNYMTPSYTMRLEVGARYSIDGRIKVEIVDVSNSFDLENKVNPYGELSFLWNKGINNLPISTSLYYMQTRYRVEDDNSELKQEQFGLKVGLAF
nr:hypothetical protein [uncultured Pseudomonas sp.]